MRYVGLLALALMVVLLVAVSLATGERGYCRMIHLIAKPLGLGRGRRGAHRPAPARQRITTNWCGVSMSLTNVVPLVARCTGTDPIAP